MMKLLIVCLSLLAISQAMSDVVREHLLSTKEKIYRNFTELPRDEMVSEA